MSVSPRPHSIPRASRPRISASRSLRTMDSFATGFGSANAQRMFSTSCWSRACPAMATLANSALQRIRNRTKAMERRKITFTNSTSPNSEKCRVIASFRSYPSRRFRPATYSVRHASLIEPTVHHRHDHACLLPPISLRCSPNRSRPKQSRSSLMFLRSAGIGMRW